ncbi:MAG: TlpA disulfide reductase family protein, partial [Acidobacteriaceae bacterium]
RRSNHPTQAKIGLEWGTRIHSNRGRGRALIQGPGPEGRVALSGTVYFWLLLAIASAAVSAAPATRPLMARRRSAPAVALAVTVCLLNVLLIARGIPAWIAHRAYQSVNRPVAPFAVEILAGQRVNSQQWKGRVVVLTFWATWCPPCRAELPQIDAIRDRYRNNPSVIFLAVNPGWNGDTEARARAYWSRHRFQLDAAQDCPIPGADQTGEAAKSLAIYTLPELVILDRSGTLRVIHNGYDDTEHLADTLPPKIDALL